MHARRGLSPEKPSACTVPLNQPVVVMGHSVSQRSNKKHTAFMHSTNPDRTVAY